MEHSLKQYWTKIRKQKRAHYCIVDRKKGRGTKDIYYNCKR